MVATISFLRQTFSSAFSKELHGTSNFILFSVIMLPTVKPSMLPPNVCPLLVFVNGRSGGGQGLQVREMKKDPIPTVKLPKGSKSSLKLAKVA
jgi:hypothetical protein